MSSKLVVASAMLRRAEEFFNKTLREEYPIGGGIRWVYNGHLRSGTVIRHAHGDRLQVRNNHTDKTYWIRGYDVLQAIATELGATA